jgi:dTDP-4-amino-4,6-dideoxygalactose transaminase
VDLFGQRCKFDEICNIADRYGLIMVEDACQALGAKYSGKMAGSIGTGVFSLSPESILNSIGGGVITTKDEKVAKRCKIIRNQGLDSNGSFVMPGLDFRIKDHQAAIARENLGKLSNNIEHRRENARYLSANIKSMIIPVEMGGSYHTWNYYTVRVPARLERNATVRKLNEAGIATEMIYWKPAHCFSHVKDIVGEISLPVTEKIANEVFSLPVHEKLSKDELGSIVTEVNKL